MGVNRSEGTRTPSASVKKASASRGSAKSAKTTARKGRARSTVTDRMTRAAKAAPASALSPSKTQSTQRAEKLVEDVTSQLQAAEQQLGKLRVEIRERSSTDDPFGVIGEIFADEIRTLLGDALPDPGAVRRAARLAVAEQAWEQRLGQLLETRDVVDALKVTKQRVSKLVKEHRLIALAHAGRSRFPAWQFAVTDTNDRDCLAAAHRRLVERGGLSPWSAASWFQAEHPELDGKDPVAFLRAGGDRTRVLTVAGRDAERAGQ